MDNKITNHKCDGCEYKSEHQEMGFRPFGVCTRTANLIEAERAYKADVCPYRKEEQKPKEANILHLFELVKDSGVSVKIERSEWANGYKITTEGRKCGEVHIIRDYGLANENSNNNFLYNVIRRQILRVLESESRMSAVQSEFVWREKTKKKERGKFE